MAVPRRFHPSRNDGWTLRALMRGRKIKARNPPAGRTSMPNRSAVTAADAARDARRRHRPEPRERVLLALLGFTGATAVVGGSLLMVRPDGSLLRVDRSALAGGPFRDWRLPGVLLAVLVGGGGLGAAGWTASRAPFDRQLAVAYGTGLVGFVIAEWVWIGPHPLEVVFGAIGLAIGGLAATNTRRTGHDQPETIPPWTRSPRWSPRTGFRRLPATLGKHRTPRW
jgi:hypothetical protein